MIEISRGMDMKIIIDGGYLSARTKTIPFFRDLVYNEEKIGLGFGMMNTIKKLVNDGFRKFAIAYDIGKSQHRNDILPSYKGQSVVKRITENEWDFAYKILGYFGVKQYYHQNHEADDVIASLLTEEEEYIYTTDKDMYQLVDENTFICHPTKHIMGVEDIVEKFGVKPKDIVGFLSLTGDKVDNIEGVKGVGIKTASKYINGESVSTRLEEKIRNHEELIERNKKLIKLKRNVEPKRIKKYQKDWYKLSKIIEKYDMKSLKGITESMNSKDLGDFL